MTKSKTKKSNPTLALSKDQVKNIISTIRDGYTSKVVTDDKTIKEVKHRPNSKIAMILQLEANLGLRIGDILQLKMNSFIYENGRYRLNIIEEKTGKERNDTVPDIIYNYIREEYAKKLKLKDDDFLFSGFEIKNTPNRKDLKGTRSTGNRLSERAVQKAIKEVCEHLKIDGKISTHSFRKYYATDIYIKSNYDVRLVQELLNHSSPLITQRYIGISSAKTEKAIEEHAEIF